MRKEAEEAGYQAMQVVAEQQAAHVPATELPEATQGIEAPMEVDQETKGTASSAKRKAEEDPSEESKKARVGEYDLLVICSYLDQVEQPQTLKRFAPICNFHDV
jgi:hypothetical protein